MDNEKKKYAAQAKYDARTRRRYVINLNKVTDPDILEHLEKIDNVQGYLKSLVRADIARQQHNPK